MRHRRRRGRHSDLESGRVNGSWSSSSSSHGFGASRTRTATASVGGRYYQQHQRFHHQRGNGSSFTTPTLILLPHGRMLVVDGTIFAQLQAENNGLDLVELGESVIRNTPSQCSVIEMDAETPSKDSMGSLGCFPPPTYESLYGKDEGADVPPSYSEILLHRFANLLDIEVQEQRGHQSNEARGSGTTSRHHSLSQHHRTSNSLNRNRLGDKDEPELRSLQNCPGSSDSGPHLVGNPLSILRASCHSLPPVHQLAHHYQIDPPSPGEQEGYTRVQVEQNRFQTMAPKPMQPRSRRASSADPSEVPEALQIGWDIQQRQHQAMRQESLEMGESGRGVEDASEDDVAGAGAAAGPQFFGSDVSLDDRYLHWDHSQRSEDSSTNPRGSTRDDRYRDEFHYSDPRQSQSYRISPRPNRRSIESELVRIHHENRLAAAEQIDWQLGDLDVRYSSEDDERRENCPSEDDNLEDDSRNFQVLTDIRESRV
ncbi:hypothetical protein QAD02_004704 [Eretmocerus hayati]|uniref:Uncharacterized protein n=1 Tax=Eretmocerus hayati TaxID=131215 RepID=A0ACC2NQQ3_9HYME|nr:hypothetical protein QAD02_004704 [Eretmocerus hayati]